MTVTTPRQIEGYLLSPQQGRLWKLQGTFDQTAFRTRFALWINGRLDRDRLRTAVQQTIERHAVLRTSFYQLDEMRLPLQVIKDSSSFTLEEFDLTGVGQFEADLRLSELLPTTREVDFKSDGLHDSRSELSLRAVLVALAADSWALMLSLPALCADAGTARVLAHEISRAYARRNEGEPESDAPFQYVQYAHWQQQLSDDEDSAAGRDFWKRHNHLLLSQVTLPFAKREFAPRPFKPESISIVIEPHEVTDLDALAKQCQSSVRVILLAVWSSLLWRLTAQSPILIGCASDGRTYDEFEEMPGLFSRYLPISADIETGLQFRKLIEKLDATTREAGEWEDGYVLEAQDANAPDKKLQIQFFPFAFEYQEAPARFESDGASFSLRQLESYTDYFHLRLFCLRMDGALTVELDFDRSVYPADYITQIADCFQTLLHSALRTPDAAIDRLNILSDALQETLLREANARDRSTALPVQQFPLVHRLFEEQARRAPSSVAVECGEQRFTYAELDARAEQLAHCLRKCGVGPDVVVGLLAEPSLEMIAGILGVLKAGGAYLPLDPVLPRERLAFMLADAEVPVLLTQAHLQAELDQVTTATLICLETSFSQTKEKVGPDVFSGAETAVEHEALTGENLAYVIYTSGSTGQPKGVMITHAGLSNYLNWAIRAYNLERGEGAPLHSSITFDLTVTSLFGPLLTGRCVVLPGETAGVEFLRQTLRESRNFSVVKITPAHARLLGPVLSADEIRAKVEVLVLGGEALSSQDLFCWTQYSPETIIVNEYGPTETVVGCCVYKLPAGAPSEELRAVETEQSEGAIPIGRPVCNAQIFILDQYLKPVPVGVRGELYIGGPGLARGYLKRPDLTADKFIPHPFSDEPGARLYRTGDLARYLLDWNIEYLERSDRQIKIQGFRVEPGEIETTLTLHPAIREAVTIAREEEDGKKYLVSYLVTNHGSSLSEDELRQFLQERLPYYMIPSSFILLNSIPLTPNGKVDRGALPLPAATGLVETSARVSPPNDLEVHFKQIWEEVLGISNIGVETNFFRLGGNSLTAVKLSARLRDIYGKRISVKTIFAYPTIRLLAGFVRQDGVVHTPSFLVPLNPHGSKPPFFCVHPGASAYQYTALAQHLGPDQPFYGVQSLGVDVSHISINWVEKIAAQFVSELRTVQPVGPYYLGGWSGGSLIAYEMAQILTAQAETVALLAIIEGAYPLNPSDAPISEEELRQGEEEILEILLADHGIETAPESFLTFDQQLHSYIEKVSRSEGMTEEYVRHYLRLSAAHEAVSSRYHPRPYPGHITLFRTSLVDESRIAHPRYQTMSESLPDESYGWGSLALGGIEIEKLPARHEDFVHEPNAKLLAERLAQYLNDSTPTE